MNPPSFLLRIRFVIFAALLACCFTGGVRAQDLPGVEILKNKKALTEAQAETEQWTLINHRVADVENKTRKIVNAILLMFLFGAFCAIWAQNTEHNVLLWFLAGFVFTVFAVLVILRINPREQQRKKRRKQHRRSPLGWNFARF